MKIKNKLETAFILSSIISIIIITPHIINYTEFYKAVEKCEIELHEVSADTTKLDQGIVILRIIFNFSNPTHFAGLTVSVMTCNLRYTIPGGQGQYLIPGLTQKISPPLEVPSYKVTTATINLTLNYLGQQSEIQDLITNIKKYKQIELTITGQYILNAYTYIFPISMGPFQQTVNFN